MSQQIATLELLENATEDDIEALIDICIEGKTNMQFFEAVSNEDGTYDIYRAESEETGEADG